MNETGFKTDPRASGKGRKERQRADRHSHPNDRGSCFEKHGYAHLKIPKGHYPPPGECRMWFPDRPPGQQPPPVSCDAPVPAGAWLIAHPPELGNRVHVTAYEPRVPGRVIAIGEFDIGSGALIRVVLSK